MSENNIPTPRTDEYYTKKIGRYGKGYVSPADFARTLERELDEARESKNRIAKRAEAIRCELVEMEKQRDEYIVNAQVTQRFAEEVATRRDEFAKRLREASAQMVEAREERDLYHNELIDTREQRDRLARDLENIMRTEPANNNGDLFYPRYDGDGEWIGDEPVDPFGLVGQLYSMVSQALATVKGKESE